MIEYDYTSPEGDTLVHITLPYLTGPVFSEQNEAIQGKYEFHFFL